MKSKIILGTVQFGLDYGISNSEGKIGKEEIFKILDFAYSNGIDILDTAYAYGDSENTIGLYNEDTDFNYKIITKIPQSCKSDTIGEVFNESLRRLKTNKIYGYLFHDYSTFRENSDLYNIILDYKNRRLIENIGFSLYHAEELEYLLQNNIEFDILQVPYNIFDRRFERYFKGLKDRKIEIHIRSVFLQGLFFLDPDTIGQQFITIRDKLLKIKQLSKNTGKSIAQLCMEFAIYNKNIDKIIIGIAGLQELKTNINIANNIRSSDIDINLYDDLNVVDENILLPYKWGKK